MEEINEVKDKLLRFMDYYFTGEIYNPYNGNDDDMMNDICVIINELTRLQQEIEMLREENKK